MIISPSDCFTGMTGRSTALFEAFVGVVDTLAHAAANERSVIDDGAATGEFSPLVALDLAIARRCAT